MTRGTSWIFVYGTLLKGQHNHGLLAEGKAVLIGPGVTDPTFTMYTNGGYPWITPVGTTAAFGEVYEVDAATLARHDRLEGHPHFYTRMHVPVTIADAGRSAVETYVLPLARHTGGAEIPSGDWRAHGRSFQTHLIRSL